MNSAAKRIPGELGLWILIFGDLFVFALFFGMFGYYRLVEPQVFRVAQPMLNQGLGLLNTFILLTSSLFVAKAMAAARAGAPHLARRWTSFAIGLGFAFVVVKVVEYSQKVSAGLVPTTNDFFMLFFAFTGIHLMHVLAGLGALTILRARVGRSTPGTNDPVVESCAIFWHMVDLLWVMLFAILYMHR